MPPPKRGASARARDDAPMSPRRGRAQGSTGEPSPRATRGRGSASPSKSGPSTQRPQRTTEDVRNEAAPIMRKGRTRPRAEVAADTPSTIKEPEQSPVRRGQRRNTERSEAAQSSSLHPPSSRSRNASQSSVASSRRMRENEKAETTSSPLRSPRRTTRRAESTTEPERPQEEPEEEGRGRRKRKLTEAAEASLSQATSRSRKASRREEEELKGGEEREEEREGGGEELTEPFDEEGTMPEDRGRDEMDLSPGSGIAGSRLVPEPPRERQMYATRRMILHEEEELHEQLLEGDVVIEEEELHSSVMYDEVVEYVDEGMEGGSQMGGGEEEEEMRRMQTMGEGRGREDEEEQDVKEPRYTEGELDLDQRGGGVEEEEDDDAPPTLEPEEGPRAEEILIAESIERGMMDGYQEEPNYIRVQSPGGTHYDQYDVDGEMYVEGVVDGMGGMMEGGEGAMAGGGGANDLRTVEFNFLDNKHICCGLCGEIVPYETLLNEHLPTNHPDVFGEGQMDLEEIPYDVWLKEKLNHERKTMENGFRTHLYPQEPPSGRPARHQRTLRRVSQIRVNPAVMSLKQLDVALKKKMIEKMGRKVKVSLVDKQHARCGICNAVVSLNKKFEVVHLVRHFNAWHPSTHRCAGTWPNRANPLGPGKPLSIQDFAVVDVGLDTPENLQCIWCGMFMDRSMLAMHFHEVHPDEVDVPKCHLCLQELVINARLIEKFGDDYEVVLPDEHHLRSNRLGQTFSTESALDRNIERRLRRQQAEETGQPVDMDDFVDDDDAETTRDPAYTNSRMTFGKRNKPKRNFIMPSLRQAVPVNSRYVEGIAEGEWRCKVCGISILAAVTSAGAIKHYRVHHPELLEDMQYELCKARLERVSDGCMEFVHPQLIECLVCSMTYSLHKPYNMCRGIRHLKTKHPEMMPEYTGHSSATAQVTGTFPKRTPMASSQNTARGRRMQVDYVQDPHLLNKLKQEFEDVEFDKVQTVYGADGEPIYVLVPDGEVIDENLAANIQQTILGVEGEEEEEDEEERYGDEDEEMDEVDRAEEEARHGAMSVEEEEMRRGHEMVVHHEEVGMHEEGEGEEGEEPVEEVEGEEGVLDEVVVDQQGNIVEPEESIYEQEL